MDWNPFEQWAFFSPFWLCHVATVAYKNQFMHQQHENSLSVRSTDVRIFFISDITIQIQIRAQLNKSVSVYKCSYVCVCVFVCKRVTTEKQSEKKTMQKIKRKQIFITIIWVIYLLKVTKATWKSEIIRSVFENSWNYLIYQTQKSNTHIFLLLWDRTCGFLYQLEIN